MLDINESAAASVVDEINNPGVAKAYKTDVLSKENLEEVHEKVLNDLGNAVSL